MGSCVMAQEVLGRGNPGFLVGAPTDMGQGSRATGPQEALVLHIAGEHINCLLKLEMTYRHLQSCKLLGAGEHPP